MEIKNNRVDFNDDDEFMAIVPPYYRVMYIDDNGRKHIAEIKDASYLQYLKDRFTVVECKFIEKQVDTF